MTATAQSAIEAQRSRRRVLTVKNWLLWTVLAFSLAVISAAAAAGPYANGVWVLWTETQSGSRPVPDAGNAATLGFPLTYAASFHGISRCSDGSNFTAGSNVGYYYDPTYGWTAAPTYVNYTLPTGGPISVGPDLVVSSPYGRFLYASSGVTCSGGSWDGGVTNGAEYLNQ